MTKQVFVVKEQDLNKTITEIENDMIKILSSSANRAVYQMTKPDTGAIAHVAKETGLMREAIRNSLFTQLSQQVGKDRIVLALDRQEIAAIVPWGEFHWRVGPQGQARYKFPTTPNTKPINPEELIADVKMHFLDSVRKELEVEGY